MNTLGRGEAGPSRERWAVVSFKSKSLPRSSFFNELMNKLMTVTLLALAMAQDTTYADVIPIDLGPPRFVPTRHYEEVDFPFADVHFTGTMLDLDFTFNNGELLRMKRNRFGISIDLFLFDVFAGSPEQPSTVSGYLEDASGQPIDLRLIAGGPFVAAGFALQKPLDIYGAHLEYVFPDSQDFAFHGLLRVATNTRLGFVVASPTPDTGSTITLLALGTLCLAAFNQKRKKELAAWRRK